MLTLLAFGIAIAAAATSDRATKALGHSWPATFVFVAVAAFVIVRFQAYDPYYLPTLRRYSTNGSGTWSAGVAGSALAAAIAVRRFGSIALALAGMVVWLCALTVILAGFGH